ncbi:MAG: hypothetical protein MAG581_02429 [Deltaproteobacteria bacterium]|nr:hypothetical protein [Deltaproteobacteria bacterium]
MFVNPIREANQTNSDSKRPQTAESALLIFFYMPALSQSTDYELSLVDLI